MNITVLGCGRWATFLGWYLSKNHNVTIWGREESKHLQQLIKERKNEYLDLPEGIKLTSSLDMALKNDILVISILASEFRSFVETLKVYDFSNKKLILCMKGIEASTGKRLSQILIENGFDKDNIAVWVGPGHVQNFVAGIPNCMLIDAYNENLARFLIKEFTTPLIRFYIGKDILGAEIGASAKNVLGIAAGMLDGLERGCLKGALMTRGTREYSRLVEKLGGDKLTPYGLSHLGDFEATLFSPFSHNRAWGESFVKGEKFQKSAEGVASVKGFYNLAKQVGVEMPITNALYNIIFNNADINKEFNNLFLRQIKTEFDD